MYRYILLCACCLQCAKAACQQCDLSLSGAVRDADNDRELAFSIVSLLNSGAAVQTDERGAFAFYGLCAGTYSLRIAHAGCSDTIVQVALQSSRSLVIRLPHELNVLRDVEIVARHEAPRPTHAVSTLDARSLDKSRGANLGEQLSQLNGLTTLNTGPTISKPMINGMQGYRILILNNGVRLEGQQWGSEHAPEIDPYLADNLTVVRGASSVRYGSDAIGGVILVEPAPMPDTASVTGEFHAAGFSNGRGGATALQLQGYFDKLKYFSWRAQGSLKKTGTIRTPDYYLRNTGSEERNFAYTLSYHRKKFGLFLYYSQYNAKVGIFSGSHFGNLTDLREALRRSKPADSLAGFSYRTEPPFQDIGHELLRASGDLHTGPRSRLHLKYTFQYNIRQEFDAHSGAEEDDEESEAAADYRLSTHFVESAWEHDYIRSWRGEFGVQGMLQENQYLRKFFIPNYLNRTFGVFGTERFVRSRFEVEAGARYDRKQLNAYYYERGQLVSPELKFENISFNTGAIYKGVRDVVLKANVASGWRSPAVNELFSDGLHHGAAAIERGSSDLGIERSISVTGTGVIDRKRLRAELTGYTYLFGNYIYMMPGRQPELTIRGAFPVYNYTQTAATISGADLLVKYGLAAKVDVTARAMNVRGLNRADGQPLIYMPADRYTLSLTLKTADLGKIRDIYFEPAWSYVSKQWRVPANLDFAPPPAAYQLFGFHAGATFLLNRQPLIVTISGNNITNTAYRDYLDRFRYYADAAGTNFTVRIRMPFTLYDKRQ